MVICAVGADPIGTTGSAKVVAISFLLPELLLGFCYGRDEH